MERSEKQLIKAFWLKNVDNLSDGEMPTRLMERAYRCGSVVTDYHERVDGLDGREVFEGSPRFVAKLTEAQLLGCIGYHFRADHFDNYHFYERENVFSLQRYVRAWLDKVSDLPVPPVNKVTYTFTSCGLNPVDIGDFQRMVAIDIDGEVKITERYVAGRNRHAVKGTTETRKAALSADATLSLFTTLCSLEDLKPGDLIDKYCKGDAIETIRFKSKEAKNVRDALRPWNEKDYSFIIVLDEILDELKLDGEDDED